MPRLLPVLMLLLPLAGAAAQPAPQPEIRTIFLQHESLSGAAGKESFVFDVRYPPGSATGWHIHHGDEYTALIEGELELRVEGRPTRRLQAGEAYHNEAGLVHETRNTGTRPARAIATLIVDKGKPLFDQPPGGGRPISIPMEKPARRE
jgi:quercetin dioxygenase-like cupin family protein